MSPAANTSSRLWARRLVPLQVWSVLVALVDGVAGLWLSVEIDVPPGAAIAIVAGGVFVTAAVVRSVPLRIPAAVARTPSPRRISDGCRA